MRLPILALTALLVVPNTAVAQLEPDAGRILQQASATYRGLSSGVFEGNTGVRSTSAGGDRDIPPREFTISFRRPSQARLEGKDDDRVIIIVNAERTWQYSPGAHQYIRDSEDWNLAASQIGQYERLTEGVERARLLWQEDIDFGTPAVKTACDVIEVMYARTGTAPERYSATFWVDRARAVILRELVLVAGRAPAGGQVELVTTTNWTAIRLNPSLSDDLFRFAPGPADTEVRTFDDPLPPPPSVPLVGAPAPAFSVEQRGGDPVTLDSLRGSVVVLNFWATWCQTCVEGIETLDRLQREFSDQRLALIGAGPEPSDQVRRFLSERGLAVRIASDPDGALARAYHLRGVPTAILIDREGIVRAELPRPRPEAEWRALLASVGIAAKP